MYLCFYKCVFFCDILILYVSYVYYNLVNEKNCILLLDNKVYFIILYFNNDCVI